MLQLNAIGPPGDGAILSDFERKMEIFRKGKRRKRVLKHFQTQL